MKKLSLWTSLGIAIFVAILFFAKSETAVFPETEKKSSPLPSLTESPDSSQQTSLSLNRPLFPAPYPVKAIYLNAYSAGNQKKIEDIINLLNSTELNAVVIDIKDYTGRIAFDTDSELINNLGSEQIKIPDFGKLIARLHENNIYVAVRIAVFQDPYLAAKKPELAIKNADSGQIWKDRKGLSWVDPASREVWNYHIELSKEAIRLGVDELNFDYVRFPSDGNLKALSYPLYNPAAKTKAEQIHEFFKYLYENLKDSGVKLSVDLFGLTTVKFDDLGIGQIIEYAFPYFDYIAPMVYPSHYSPGFLGYKNPAAYPYEVAHYSLKKAQERRAQLQFALLNNNIDPQKSTATSTEFILKHIKLDKIDKNAKLGTLRPWLQVFDLGTVYTPEMVRKQIQATYDNNLDAGWYLWNPSNIYHEAALLKE